MDPKEIADLEARELAHRTRLMWSVLGHVKSLGGVCPMSSIVAYCRTKGWNGMAPTIVVWLERENRVTHDSESGMVYDANLTNDGEDDPPQTREDA